MNQITIELCAEDRARLDRQAAALEYNSRLLEALLLRLTDEGAKPGPAPVQVEPPATSPDNATETAEAVTPPVAHPADDVAPWEAPEPTPAPSPAPAPKAEVSLAEFQKALSLRCAESDTTKAKVRALLQEYAEAASKVPPEKRAEVLERLAAL
jgi:hypothetical protein